VSHSRRPQIRLHRDQPEAAKVVLRRRVEVREHRSHSCITTIAVKVFVIDPIRKTVSPVIGIFAPHRQSRARGIKQGLRQRSSRIGENDAVCRGQPLRHFLARTMQQLWLTDCGMHTIPIRDGMQDQEGRGAASFVRRTPSALGSNLSLDQCLGHTCPKIAPEHHRQQDHAGNRRKFPAAPTRR
jgi:hypothetical protein